MAKLKLNKQLDLLENDGNELMLQFEKNQKDEMDFIADVRKKYGDGTLDPKTGVFTPGK